MSSDEPMILPNWVIKSCDRSREIRKIAVRRLWGNFEYEEWMNCKFGTYLVGRSNQSCW